MDQDAEFIYMPYEQVLEKASELNAVPFDILKFEFTHYKEECTFNYIIKKYKIDDLAVLIIAGIIRGADTDRHEIAAESAGLWAVSAGLTHNATDDHKLLETGMVLYDALYSWASSNKISAEQPL